VDDIAQARLQGLDGCARWDAVADVRSVQQGPIGFAGEYDSVFASASAPLQLHDGTHRLDVAQSPTMGQTVVWNPGAALCARLADMPPEGHAHMLCVEAAQIDTPVHLAPGASWTGWQRLRA
jgi:glucose-6-phosphate 1-epimerase